MNNRKIGQENNQENKVILNDDLINLASETFGVHTLGENYNQTISVFDKQASETPNLEDEVPKSNCIKTSLGRNQCDN